MFNVYTLVMAQWTPTFVHLVLQNALENVCLSTSTRVRTTPTPMGTVWVTLGIAVTESQEWWTVTSPEYRPGGDTKNHVYLSPSPPTD